MNILRISIVTIASFITLTAIGGGLAILVGADEFPLEWLSGTPFKDYTIPALILIFIVGGSALITAIAAIRALTQHPIQSPAAAIAGLIMSGHIVVEVSILKQVPPGPTWIEGVYFSLGCLLLLLGLWQWKSEHQKQSEAND